MYNNPFMELHKAFKEAGAEVLISSGQACVLYGIAAFSKDGDWIVKEDETSMNAVLSVLEKRRALYRFGAPLNPAWHSKGWTSHFEYVDGNGMRIRTDFCSRPPRTNFGELWARAVSKDGLDVVDVEDLLHIKQTRRVRDYPIIGSIAEAAGLEKNEPELALNYLQDFLLLKQAVDRWPEEARKMKRNAVRLLVANAPRSEVVSAIAHEQDETIRDDEIRISAMTMKMETMRRNFAGARQRWEKEKTNLWDQHYQMLEISGCLI